MQAHRQITTGKNPLFRKTSYGYKNQLKTGFSSFITGFHKQQPVSPKPVFQNQFYETGRKTSFQKPVMRNWFFNYKN
jgi:hypothetical protein